MTLMKPATVLAQLSSSLWATREPVRSRCSWMIWRSTASMEIIRLADLAWAYIQVTEFKKRGSTRSESRELMLYTRDERRFALDVDQLYDEDLLDALRPRCPDITIGIHPELAALWKNDKSAVLERLTEVDTDQVVDTTATHGAVGAIANIASS